VIAFVLGGAPSVWDDLEQARTIFGGHSVVVAANLAGIHFEGRLDAWCSLHSDRLAGWCAERTGNAPRLFVPTSHSSAPTAEIVPERWPGSSGLYALQIALDVLGASGAVLCGMPMDSAAGHFINPGPWASTVDYRQAFARALPTIGGRVRSTTGWTSELFGPPSRTWAEAINLARPSPFTAPEQRRLVMHTVTNTSDTTQSFNSRTPTGDLQLVHLASGESGQFDVDPAQPKFNRGTLKISEPDAEGEAKTKPAKPARQVQDPS
jgi:hypothetical protein